tara:strand:- start:43 stop:663 length:621 start_codon:yes stop_codon:yes gene_type:complete
MVSKASWTSGSLFRAEQSGNLGANQSEKVFEIHFDERGDSDNMEMSNGTGHINTANAELIETNRPICINEYKITVASSDLVLVHQSYAREGGERNNAFQWNTNHETFHNTTKDWIMVPGAKIKSQVIKRWEDEGTLETDIDVLEYETWTNNQYAVRTMGFKRRKGSKGIILSKNKAQSFGLTISNISGNDDTFYYAVVEVVDWAVL